MHVLGDSSVRFHNADRVNFIVMSMTFSCILPRTIDNSFFMYEAWEPSVEVCSVEILAAKMLREEKRIVDKSQ